MCLLEARLEASDVGLLVREAHPRGGGLVGGGQVGVPERRPALRGRLLCGVGVVCRVEECAEGVRCSLPSAEGVCEPAARGSEVGFPPELSPKPSKTLELGLFWSTFVCCGVVLQNSAAHQRTCIL